MCSLSAKRASAFVIGVLGVLVAGSIYSYNIYAPSMQLTFNFTQEEVDTIPSLGHLGFCLGMPAGLARFKFGSTLVSSIGFVVSTTGYLLIWSSFLFKYSYHFKAWLMAFYYFIAGHGLVYLYMEALMVNMKNFPKQYRGTVVGLLDAIFGASGGIFVLIYKLGFVDSFDWSDHEEDQNLVGFTLFLSSACGLVGLLSVVGLREYKYYPTTTTNIQQGQQGHPRIRVVITSPDVREYTSPAYEYPRNDSESSSIMLDDDDGDQEDLIPIVGTRPRFRVITGDHRDDQHPSGGDHRRRSIAPDQRSIITDQQRSGDHSSSSETGEASSSMVTFWSLLKSLKFHCLIWTFAFTGGVCFVLITNIDFVLKSFGLGGDYIFACLLTTAACNGASRIACGLISDKCLDRGIPRSNFCILTLIPLSIISTLVIFFADRENAPAVLIIWFVSIGVAFGSMWCLIPTIVSERYKLRYFGLYWGSILFVSAVFGLGLQRLFGYFYDLRVPEGDLVCNDGIECFRWSFVLFAGLIWAALICLCTFSKLDT